MAPCRHYRLLGLGFPTAWHAIDRPCADLVIPPFRTRALCASALYCRHQPRAWRAVLCRVVDGTPLGSSEGQTHPQSGWLSDQATAGETVCPA